MDVTFAVDFNNGAMPKSETTTFKSYEEAATYFNDLPDNCARILSVFTDFRASTITWVSTNGRTWVSPNLPQIFKDYEIK